MTNAVQLGEIIQLRKGKKATEVHEQRVNGAKPYIQIDEVRGIPPQKFASDAKGVVVAPNDLCIVWDGANAGTVGYGVTGLIGSTVARMRIKAPDVWDTEFVGRLLQSKFRQLNDAAQARGATIPHVDKAKLEAIELPRIGRSEQKRIATILERADDIRRKREESLRLADRYLQSVFNQMFGDLHLNSSQWDTVLLGDILRVDPQNGLYRPAKDYGSGTPILRIDGFYDGYLAAGKPLKKLRIDAKTVEKYLLFNDDIVINRVNSKEYLGKSTLIEGLTEDTVFESNMMRLRVKNDVAEPRFIVDQLQTRYVKLQILRAAKDAVNQSSINQTDVKNLEVRLPEVELQRRYAGIVQKKIAADAALQTAFSEAKTLFSSLAQRAFRGEL